MVVAGCPFWLAKKNALEVTRRLAGLEEQIRRLAACLKGQKRCID